MTPTHTLSSTLFLLANIFHANAQAQPVKNLLNSLKTSESFPISPGFDIAKVTAVAAEIPSHSWEYGTSAQALLELHDKEYSVFGSSPFPVPKLSRDKITSLTYAALNIKHGVKANGLGDGHGSVGDPLSLGVSAVMLGKEDQVYTNAMKNSVDYLLNRAPRFYNGAISHRSAIKELWADWMYMVPPSIAYYAADIGDAALLQESVRQCRLYRQVLKSNVSDSTPYAGAWEHIIGPQSQDKGIWATGNAWAAGGMTRVLATIIKAPIAKDATWRTESISSLNKWIKEIVDGVRGSSRHDGLVRNYLNINDPYAGGFGEISGSSMIAAVIYRMAVLSPDIFGTEYIAWADDIRRTLAGKDANGNPHITSSGIVTPAVNPLNWKDREPFRTGSPEGQAFVVLMYAAWRDCVQVGVCQVNDLSVFRSFSAQAPTCPTRRNRGLARRSNLLRFHKRQSGLSSPH